MDINLVLSFIFGVCLTLLIIFIFKDIVVYQIINFVLSNVKIQPVQNSDKFTDVMMSYSRLLKSTIDSLNLLLDDGCLEHDDRKILRLTRDSLEDNFSSINMMIKDLEESSKYGN